MILDTNALTAIAEGDPRVVRTISEAVGLVIPVIALGEYRFGIALSRHRRQYERWLARMLEVVEVAPIDEDTASVYAKLRLELRAAGTPLPSNDVWIAALCRQRGQPVLLSGA